MLKRLEAHVIALPEHDAAVKRVEQLASIVAAKARVAEATREAFALGCATSVPRMEEGVRTLPLATARPPKATMVEFAPATTEEKALKRRVETLQPMLAAKQAASPHPSTAANLSIPPHNRSPHSPTRVHPIPIPHLSQSRPDPA